MNRQQFIDSHLEDYLNEFPQATDKELDDIVVSAGQTFDTQTQQAPSATTSISQPSMTRQRLQQLEAESMAAQPSYAATDALKAVGGAVGQVAQQAPAAAVGTAAMIPEFAVDVLSGLGQVSAEIPKRLGIISPETAQESQAGWEALAQAHKQKWDTGRQAVQYATGEKSIEQLMAEEEAQKQAMTQAQTEPQAFGVPGANRLLDATQGLATLPFQPAITLGNLIGGGIRESRGETSPELQAIRENAGQEIMNMGLARVAYKGLLAKAKAMDTILSKDRNALTPEEQAAVNKVDEEMRRMDEEAAATKQPVTQTGYTPEEVRTMKMTQGQGKGMTADEMADTVRVPTESPTATVPPPQNQQATTEFLTKPQAETPRVTQPANILFRKEQPIAEGKEPMTVTSRPTPESMMTKPVEQLFKRKAEPTATAQEPPTTQVAEPKGIEPQPSAEPAVKTPLGEEPSRPKTGPGMFGGATMQNLYEETAPKIKRGLDIFKKKTKEFIADEEGFYSPEKLEEAIKAVKDKFIGKIKRGQSTQVTNTINTYGKILDRIADKAKGQVETVRVADVSTGLGMSEELAKNLGYKNYETTEPFPAEGFIPTYKDSTLLPDNAFDFITNNQVLNVVPKDIRDGIVKDIGRALKEGGTAIISTRGKDVMAATTGRAGEEPMSLYIPAKDAQGKSYEQYQKGFTNAELKDYIQGLLGDGFEVKTAPFGAAGVEITKTKKVTPKIGMMGAGTLQNIYEQQVEPTVKKGVDALFGKWANAYEQGKKTGMRTEEDLTKGLGLDITQGRDGKVTETEHKYQPRFVKDKRFNAGAISFDPLVDKLKDAYKKGREEVGKLKKAFEESDMSVADNLYTILFERWHPSLKAIKKTLGKDRTSQVFGTIEKSRYADNAMRLFGKVGDLFERTAKRLQEADLDLDDFGTYAQARRVFFERSAQGVQSRLTKDQAKHILQNAFPPKQKAALELSFEDFQNRWQETIAKEITESEVLDPKTAEYIKKNANYTRDVVIDKLLEDILDKGDARSQDMAQFHLKGTSKDILNPIEETLKYARALTHFTRREVAKRANVEALTDAGIASDTPKAGYEPVKYKHKGEWVEKYLPKTIAETIMDAPVELHGAVKWLDSKIFNNKLSKFMTRNIIVNPGFMVGNSLQLDPITIWAQLPSVKSKIGYPLVHALNVFEKLGTPYAKELANKLGIKDMPTTEKEMTEQSIFNVGTLYGKASGEESELGNMMRGLNVSEKTVEFFTGEKPNLLSKGIGKLEGAVSEVDNISKVSLWRYLQAYESWRGNEKIAEMVREMGTPATKRSGTGEPFLRRGTLFGNAILQAGRATAKNFADNPVQFTLSNMAIPVALAAGVISYVNSDPETKRKWDTLSEYQKKNFLNIDTGLGTKEKPTFFTLPLPRIARIFYGIALDIMENDKDFSKMAHSIVAGLAQGAFSELPSGMSRPLALGADVATYMSGKAPYDYYRKQYVIPEQVMDADATVWNKLMGDSKLNDLSTTKAFGKYLLNTYGLAGWWNLDTMNNIPKGSEWTKIPGVNRLFRIGSAGVSQKLYEAKAQPEKIDDRARVIISNAVKQSVDSGQPIKFTKDLNEAIARVPKALERSIMKETIRKRSKGGDKIFTLIDAMKNASPFEKLEILKAFKKLK